MVLGIVFSGIAIGLGVVGWAIAKGYPLLMLLLLYPAAGLVGAALFLLVVLVRGALPAPRPRHTFREIA